MPELGEEEQGLEGLEIPERLELRQNIAQQPPFTWIWEEEIVPDDFFLDPKNDEGRARLLLLSVCLKPENRRNRSSRPVAGLLPFLNPRYKVADIAIVAPKILKYLERYPLSADYLREYMGGPSTRDDRFYNWDGKRIEQRVSSGETLSYAGYVVAQKRVDKASKLVGLEEILDKIGWSDQESMGRALPAKGRANRRFRLRRQLRQA